MGCSFSRCSVAKQLFLNQNCANIHFVVLRIVLWRFHMELQKVTWIWEWGSFVICACSVQLIWGAWDLNADQTTNVQPALIFHHLTQSAYSENRESLYAGQDAAVHSRDKGILVMWESLYPITPYCAFSTLLIMHGTEIWRSSCGKHTLSISYPKSISERTPEHLHFYKCIWMLQLLEFTCSYYHN